MKFVRKSRWRSVNQKLAKFRANQRAAKERKRLASIDAEPALSTSAVRTPRTTASAIVTVRFADGLSFSTRITQSPFPSGGIYPSKTAILRDIATTLDLL